MLRGMDDPDGLLAIIAKRLSRKQRKDGNFNKAEFKGHQIESGHGLEGDAAIVGSVDRP
jgi:hypothetical protein